MRKPSHGVLAVSADYLNLAVESARKATALRRIVVFDYHPEADEHRENLERARLHLREAGMSAVVDTLAADAVRGAALPAEPLFTAGTDEKYVRDLKQLGVL